MPHSDSVAISGQSPSFMDRAVRKISLVFEGNLSAAKSARWAGTDSSLNHGMALELGLPSICPGGTAIFAAAFRRNSQARWDIFPANLDDHTLSRVALFSSFPALEMVIDPAPFAQSDGSIVFAVRTISRGSLSPFARPQTELLDSSPHANLDGYRVLPRVAFGSFSPVVVARPLFWLHCSSREIRTPLCQRHQEPVTRGPNGRPE